MRIAHFGDLHVTDGPRLADQAATLNAIVDDILAADVDLVLIGGDLAGHTVPHDATPREQAVLFGAFRRLLAVAPCLVIAGNHDNLVDIANLAHLGNAWPLRIVTGAEAVPVQTRSGVVNVYALAYPTKRWLLAGEVIEGGVVGAQRAVEDRLGALLGMWGHRIRRRRATHPGEPHVGLMHVQVAGCVTSGGEVLAGQEIELSRAQLNGVPFDFIGLSHLHMEQEVAHRARFPSSTWRNDHSELDPKGWALWDVGDHGPPEAKARIVMDYPATPDRHAARYQSIPSPCRTFLTLDYRWAADRDDGIPRWIERPSDAAISACADAEVRMRLVVPEQWVGGCPWADEVARVESLAVRVKVEKTIEPTLRVRAPEVAAAETPEAKMRAYWRTLATPPDPSDQSAALDAMAMLDTMDDAGIAGELATVPS